jgi:molecular chaperone HtpG
MEKKQFKAESKRLLDMMINSIYSQREIFLRELISNASDAIDKIYYRALSDDNLSFDKDSYYLKVVADKEHRILKITDTGIGMTKEELENNLGTIANSGSLAFKNENELKDGHDIIGQFGVGFYSAFMVADVVTVISKALGSDEAYKWESNGADGYTIEPYEQVQVGTEIILKIKENTEAEKYEEYLEEDRLKAIIKKYSDFIRYPIKMDVTGKRPKEGSENEFEDYQQEQVINSMAFRAPVNVAGRQNLLIFPAACGRLAACWHRFLSFGHHPVSKINPCRYFMRRKREAQAPERPRVQVPMSVFVLLRQVSYVP